MRIRLPRVNRTLILAYSLFTLSAVILLASIMLTTNITVLKDWKLSTPAKEIHAGDTVTLISEYTKLRDVSGKSVRYIECQNDQGVYIRYPLNEAVANRAKGKGGTGVVVKVPDTIPNIPAKCKFTIAITYDVYPWRKVNISNSTNTFILLPKRDVPQEVSSNEPSSSQTDQGQVATLTSGQILASSSSSNNTPTSTNPQSNSSQPDGMPTSAERTLSPTPQPADTRSRLDKLPLLGGLFNAVGL